MADFSPIDITVPDFSVAELDSVLPGAAILADIDRFRRLRRKLLADVKSANYFVNTQLVNKIRGYDGYSLDRLISQGQEVAGGDATTAGDVGDEDGEGGDATPTITDEEAAVLGVRWVYQHVNSLQAEIDCYNPGGSKYSKFMRRKEGLEASYHDLESRRVRYLASLQTQRRIAMVVTHDAPQG